MGKLDRQHLVHLFLIWNRGYGPGTPEKKDTVSLGSLPSYESLRTQRSRFLRQLVSFPSSTVVMPLTIERFLNLSGPILQPPWTSPNLWGTAAVSQENKRWKLRLYDEIGFEPSLVRISLWTSSRAQLVNDRIPETASTFPSLLFSFTSFSYGKGVYKMKES